MMRNIKFTTLILLTCLFFIGCADSIDMPQVMDTNDNTSNSLSMLRATTNGSTYIKNLSNALDHVNYYKYDNIFNTGVAKTDKNVGEYHMQGISYWNGYYYISRSRKPDENDQQLLILDEFLNSITYAITLDTSSHHPSSLQIYNGILAITFSNPDMLKFYDVTQSPTQPQFKAQLNNAGGIGVGITEYNDNYLVATYTARDGGITFRLFDKSFNLIEEKEWHASNQDKSNWFPFQTWQDGPGKNSYENLNLIKEQSSPVSPPNYYLIMYHSEPARLHVFYLTMNGTNLANLGVTIVRDVGFEKPVDSGFRMGAGLAISENNERLRFFAVRKHIYPEYSFNVMTQYNSHPWEKEQFLSIGEQADISVDDQGNCLALYRNSADAVYYKVGKMELGGNYINWGPSYVFGNGSTKSWGTHVSVALNNYGTCVATNKYDKYLYYRVGQLNSTNKTVDWGPEYRYDTGGDMSIDINDRNEIVEVHQGYSTSHKNNHYYSLGTISVFSKSIIWKRTGTQFDTGGPIAIALDNNGNCINTHLGSQSSVSHRNNRYYRTGKIDSGNGVVTWGTSVEYDTGGNGDIAILDNGRFVEVHKGSSTHANNHYYKTGVAIFTNGRLYPNEEALFQEGGDLSCDVNNNGVGMLVFEKDGGLYYRVFK